MPNFTDPMFLIVLFYLYALIKWDIVKRPPLYFLGVVGLLIAFVGAFFVVGEKGGYPTAQKILEIIGLLVAFVSAVVCCAGASVSMQGMIGAAKAAIPPSEANSDE